jgi:hypothetical protein
MKAFITFKTLNFLLLTSVAQVIFACLNYSSQKVEKNEPEKYALLIGGGTEECDSYESFYANILYVYNILIKLNYNEDHIRVLFFGREEKNEKIIDECATKKIFIKELFRFVEIMDANDSLLIFRSGHGTLGFIDHKIIGVMNFSDGCLSSLELVEILKKISAKQIVIILNQCFCGQFADITLTIPNAVVVSQTKESEVAINESRKTVRWNFNEWPFVKCLFDGFLGKISPDKKKSIYDSFQYMLDCNPNTKGVPIQADRPLLKENPNITYGNGVKKGSVYIY